MDIKLRNVAYIFLSIVVLVLMAAIYHAKDQNLKEVIKKNQRQIEQNAQRIKSTTGRLSGISKRIEDAESSSAQTRQLPEQTQREGQTTTLSPKVLNHVDGGVLTVDALAGLFRDGGFTISRGITQTTARWGPVHVRISGSNNVREIFVTGNASSSQEENAAIVLGMQLALSSTVGWGEQWVIDTMGYTIRRASESGTKVYAKNDLKDDVFVRLETDLGRKLITLEIERYQPGVSF